MKRTKIIYGIGISLIVLLIVGIVFYYMNFMKKVVCTREGAYYTETPQTDTIIFKFKLDGTVKKGLVNQVFDFETEEGAKKYFELIPDQEKYKKELKNKNVIVTFEEKVSFDDKEYKRKDIIKTYKELGYECK